MADEAPENSDVLENPARDQATLGRKWIAEIKAAEKAQAKWVERGKKIEKIYADERDLRSDRARKFNILWSNVETLRPAVYMKTPKAQASRRYRDRDPVARFAGLLLERGLQTSCELYDFDNAMEQAVRDRLLPGRGQAWTFYEPTIENGDIAYESVSADYVPWQDFLHSVARTWTEVRWVGRRFYKTRSELRDWIKEKELTGNAEKIALDYSVDGDKADEGLKDERSKAQIWEVWDKTSGKVLYVAPGSGEYAIVGQVPPAIHFKDFFPCPRPLLATTTAKSLIPTPDYALYQDQAEELNRITERIGVLQSALKIVGIYDGEEKALADLLTGSENEMIPVSNWAMFSDGGGAGKRIEFFPVREVMEVLKGLYETRDQAKQTLYEVSGIGDILRGATDPDETATAQGIKAQWGSQRVRRIQKDVQRFAADIMRLKAEVLSEVFRFQELLRMAGVDDELLAKFVPPVPMQQIPPNSPPEMQQMAQAAQQQAQLKANNEFLQKVEQLLRDDAGRTFRISVETDSTLEPDAMEEKQTAIEFMSAMTTFMEKAAPMAAAGPEAAKLVGELLLFAVRRFDKVETLEQAIEQGAEAAEKRAKQAQQQGPPKDPKLVEAETKAQIAQQEQQRKAQESQQDAQLKREEFQAEMQMRQQELQASFQEMMGQFKMDMIKLQAEMGLKREAAAQDAAIKAENAEREGQLQEAGFERETQLMERGEDRADEQAKREAKREKAE